MRKEIVRKSMDPTFSWETSRDIASPGSRQWGRFFRWSIGSSDHQIFPVLRSLPIACSSEWWWFLWKKSQFKFTKNSQISRNSICHFSEYFPLDHFPDDLERLFFIRWMLKWLTNRFGTHLERAPDEDIRSGRASDEEIRSASENNKLLLRAVRYDRM